MRSIIPREKIDWHPTIDYDACLNDRVCLEFCKNDVFIWKEKEMLVEVENPLNCVVGCTSCAQLCAVEAIHFPDQDELKRALRRLRAEQTANRCPSGCP